ncbi:uncharacterized protein LOC132708740 [Cylas formicarius]|uniref:uncharacterized protein LOC132708740 n=1 Tax=Cylas formicarius TaxID=197179 RepID=UPI0029588CD0|nr:uncharacterized protein LOC132708740 [Cylas formicarius]
MLRMMENRSNSENVKTVVSVYLHRRQFPIVKPKKTTRTYNIKRALLENRLGRTHYDYDCGSSDPMMVVEYIYLFQNFMYWLKDQMKYKQRCFDIERLAGPLFCHFYLDMLSSEHSEKAISFFNAHVDKLDKSKCDDTVLRLIKAVTNNSDIIELEQQIRSSKIVAELTTESLFLLKKFVSESLNVVFLQTFQKWFDLRTSCDKLLLKEEKNMIKSGLREHEHNKLQSVIREVKKLQINVCNIRVTNCKNGVACGFIKRQLGAVAVAEKNVLRIMPLHALDSLFNLTECFSEIKLNNHSKQIYCIAVSSKNDILCTGSADRSICIYNMLKIQLHLKVYGHLGPVYCIAISECSKYLASGSQDSTARVWNITTGKALRIYAGHTQPVTCLQFHPNTMYLATGSADKNIRVWCLKTASPVRLLHGAKGVVFALAFDPTGQSLASAGEDKKIRVWDLITSKITQEFRSKDAPVVKLAWNTTSKQLGVGTLSGTIKVWDISHHSEDHKHLEPAFSCQVNGSILSLEYTMGIWSSLSA